MVLLETEMEKLFIKSTTDSCKFLIKKLKSN